MKNIFEELKDIINKIDFNISKEEKVERYKQSIRDSVYAIYDENTIKDIVIDINEDDIANVEIVFSSTCLDIEIKEWCKW